MKHRWTFDYCLFSTLDAPVCHSRRNKWQKLHLRTQARRQGQAHQPLQVMFGRLAGMVGWSPPKTPATAAGTAAGAAGATNLQSARRVAAISS